MKYTDFAISAVRLFLNLILFGTPIVISLALAFRLTRVASPRVRYLLAIGCFFAVALIPVVLTLQKDSNSLPYSSRVSSTGLNKVTLLDLAPNRNTNSSSSQNGIAISRTQGKTNVRDQVSISVERIGESPLGFWLLRIWIGIAFVLVGREVLGHLLLGKIRRAWQPASVELRDKLEWPPEFPLFTHTYEWPCTTGFFKPRIVLPAGLSSALSEADMKSIARHELSHARWRDPLINSAVRLVRAVLWPSLPLWFVERIVRAEREVAADRAAIASAESSREVSRVIEQYATALVTVARGCANRKVPGLYGSAATHINTVRLEARIHRLFKFSEPLTLTRVLLGGALLLSGVAGVAVVPLTSQGLDARERADQRTLNVARRLALSSGNSPAAQQSTSAMNMLIGALKKRDWRLDGDVQSALAQIRSSGSIEPLLITLQEDRDWRVREKIAWTLGQLNDRRAVEPLIVALRDDAGEVRQTAAWSLGVIGDNHATDALIANLTDNNFDARQGAAWALGKMRDPRAVEPLIVLLSDRFADVRHGAAWALGEIGDKRAVEPLRAASKDSDADVRAQAEAALSKLHID